MFGGGRYNGLADIFGVSNFPAIGFAPGDETTRLFLESWGMIDKIVSAQPINYYLPLLDNNLLKETNHLAKTLRVRNLNIISGLEEQKIGKALEFANKKKIAKVIIFGTEEKERGVYKIKDMVNGGEETIKI
jgi:histidyl-tRNA synthetase